MCEIFLRMHSSLAAWKCRSLCYIYPRPRLLQRLSAFSHKRTD